MSLQGNKIRTYKVLGLMSGSSLDGLDMALCSFDVRTAKDNSLELEQWTLVDATTAPYSDDWQNRLQQLPQQSALEFAKTHVDFGHYMGSLAQLFLNQIKQQPDCIASHGHTIFHFPDQQFTAQIGDGASLAAKTGCAVINDFRSLDLALGGQGAPLAPLADQWLLPSYDFYLNLGGIANVSCNTGDHFVAFDIGGANQILNALVQPLGLAYDKGGQLAAKGQLNKDLLAQSNRLPYFSQPYPKSLGNDWVQEQQIASYVQFDCPVEDKLHTACVQIGQQIAASIQQIIKNEGIKKSAFKLLTTGGGAFNSFLVKCIEQATNAVVPIKIEVPAPEIINFKEACLIALMGVLRIEQYPNCLASVTGAKKNVIGGALYLKH